MQISLYRILAALYLLSLSCLLDAQHYNYPLDNYSKLYLLRSDTQHYGAFQGLPTDWLSVDSLKGFEHKTRYSVFDQKLHEEHLIQIETPDFNAYIDFLLNFEVGLEQRLDNEYQDTTRMSRNMRGFIIRGDIGKKVSFETSFREHQSFVPFYLFEYTLQSRVMPGTGRVKEFNATGRDHSIAGGYIAYAPSDWANIQFGTQKNFIGSGYRSLLLSDNAYNYPQLKGSFKFLQGKLHYHVIHAWLQTLNRLPLGDTPESLFVRKNGSFKYLEVRPIDEISIGLFEGVMWNRFQPGEGTQSINSLAYSPIIGTSAIALGLDDVEDNVMLGVDLSVRPMNELLVYSQYVLDRDNRDGFQIGIRTIDLGLNGLSFRAEYNSVAPFTYANSNIRQNQGHFGQAIAHPMGAAFDELHMGLMYFYNRWFVNASYSGADQLIDPHDEDSDCTTGGDIFSTQSCIVEDTRPYQARLEHVDVRLGRMFNPRSNFNAYIGWMFRERTGAAPNQEQSMFKFGIEMSLFNSYEDF